ncbi:MAG: sigma-70 family RNA polymerase sigma factor [Myxococcales bacterium]|nr:sigma-70 family RNA polymerase sigma factor [Myxococcales bacterium]
MDTRTQTRNQLISEHTEVARRIALKMARRCPNWVAREDLVAAGMLGLTEAAARYDGTRTEPFLSFAEHRIRGAVLDELRRGDMLPRRVRQLARKISNTIRSLENSGESPCEQKIADSLGVPVEQYRSGLSQLVNVGVDPIEHDDQILVADARRAPDELAAHRHHINTLRGAHEPHEQRDVTILGLHYLEDLTYQQIAETLRITPSRVCQLLWRAVERVRAQLGEQTMAEAA